MGIWIGGFQYWQGVFRLYTIIKKIVMKVILTGATGMVGEGVLLECLRNPKVSEVLVVGRRHYQMEHPKLKELLVPDFLKMDAFSQQLKGYDACFFCAGISSVGMSVEKFTAIAYDTTVAVAKTLVKANPDMVFHYVSGAGTKAHGRQMWQRVKGKTENDLLKLGFKGAYSYRPGIMLPFPEQKNFKPVFKFLVKLIRVFAPKQTLTMKQVEQSMINVAEKGYSKTILEVTDIRETADEKS